ncbi:Chorismate mutase I / Cyclohexadienyl dehydrogenase [hydrothermal vent metagenome]|uniref:Chorismate mutase I / Cyclohexadienyl dehydrogenase n=1 Tax=hydrothermal vent metagenome TaxID=652676 RepID=A0A3B0V6H2_9ZZZZ
MDNLKLAKLRKNLDKIDEQIIGLLAERQMNVDAIGSVKLSTKSPTRDYTREKQVIDNIMHYAALKNIDPEIAKKIFSLIIKTSLEKQENQKISTSSYGSKKSALVIGGLGKMGQWFVRFLSNQGFKVDISDINLADNSNIDFKNSDLNYDYIIVAAPITASAKILEDLAQLQPSGIVLDIGSIKSPLKLPLMQLADSGCKVVSIHPMFGPDIKLLSNKHVIFINLGDSDSVNKVKQLFQPTMAEQIDMQLEDHDRLVAYILGLSHIVNIAFMLVLAESGEAADTLAQMSSTTFDAQLAIGEKVVTENPHLYFEIQKLNNYSKSTLNALGDAVQRIITIVNNNQEQAFVGIMHKAQQYIESRKNL